VSLLKRSLLREGGHCCGASCLAVSFVVPRGCLDVDHPHEHHDWEVCSTLIIWRSRFFWWGSSSMLAWPWVSSKCAYTLFFFIRLFLLLSSLICLKIFAMANLIIHIMVVCVFMVGINIWEVVIEPWTISSRRAWRSWVMVALIVYIGNFLVDACYLSFQYFMSCIWTFMSTLFTSILPS
jgi:hypothetical protein